MKLRPIVISFFLALSACGSASSSGAPLGRCETDSDCASTERCAQVALVCDAPPFCGACVPR